MMNTSRIFRIFGLLLLAGVASLFPAVAQNGDGLLVEADFREQTISSVDVLKVVSFNLHGPPTGRIEEVYRVLQEDQRLRDAHVFLLQEVNRGHGGSGNRDIGRELAQRLSMHYTYAVEIEHGQGGGVRGLAVLSRFPIEDTRRIQLPVAGPGGRRRIALGTTLVAGSKRIRLYNLHLETRISSVERVQQIQGILDDAEQFSDLPTVLVGDFNTITTASTRGMRELMEEAGFASALPGNQVTFRRAFVVRMVLDWIWARNLPIEEAAVASDIRVSDHHPLWFSTRLP